MTGKCKIDDCPAPISCHEGVEDYRKCENWIENNPEEIIKERKTDKDLKRTNLSWGGEAFKLDELSLVSIRNSPVIIGIVGKADAGKTTFLAMLYTLLLNGKKMKDYNFSGTKTVLGWDQLHFKLRIYKDKVSFPDPTPSGYNRLFHLALRNSEERLIDVFLTDTSGEAFHFWSQNRDDDNAENARWIYYNSNAFILFIDCVDLICRKNLAKTEIIDIAQQLRHDLKDRPVIAVWSKADKKEEIHTKIKDSLKEELRQMFTNYTEIDISNFSSQDPDKLVHINNLEVIDWLMNRIMLPTGTELVIDINSEQDTFFNYKLYD